MLVHDQRPRRPGQLSNRHITPSNQNSCFAGTNSFRSQKKKAENPSSTKVIYITQHKLRTPIFQPSSIHHHQLLKIDLKWNENREREKQKEGYHHLNPHQAETPKSPNPFASNKEQHPRFNTNLSLPLNPSGTPSFFSLPISLYQSLSVSFFSLWIYLEIHQLRRDDCFIIDTRFFLGIVSLELEEASEGVASVAASWVLFLVSWFRFEGCFHSLWVSDLCWSRGRQKIGDGRVRGEALSKAHLGRKAFVVVLRRVPVKLESMEMLSGAL